MLCNIMKWNEIKLVVMWCNDMKWNEMGKENKSVNAWICGKMSCKGTW